MPIVLEPDLELAAAASTGRCTPPRCDWAQFSVEIRDRHTSFPEKPGQLCTALSEWLLVIPKGSIKLASGKRVFTSLEEHEFFFCPLHREEILRGLPYMRPFFTRI